MNVNTDGLPPEMQARIAQIIEGAKQKAAVAPAQQSAPDSAPESAPQQTAPVVRPPSLMDHTIALRQEVNALRQELHAAAQVIEAVGNAVGELYSMFQSQTTPSSFSSGFQTSQSQQVDNDY